MGYRQVIITESEKIRVEDNNLVVIKQGISSKVPLEDINFILLEDIKTLITAKLLSEIGKYSICLVCCNEKHDPTTICYSYNYHFKQLENVEIQLNVSESLNGVLWKQLIFSKIENQKSILILNKLDEKNINLLTKYQKEIKEGDSTNREGLAAKIYFKSLYGSAFLRFSDDATNAALNYGYTIIRSAIVKQLVISGLNTYIGINHKSKVNNFNLAYDLIEPYRAVVDKYVYENFENLTYPLSFETRKEIVNLLNSIVFHDEKKYTVEYSIDLLIKSYIKCLKGVVSELSLPKIISV